MLSATRPEPLGAHRTTQPILIGHHRLACTYQTIRENHFSAYFVFSHALPFTDGIGGLGRHPLGGPGRDADTHRYLSIGAPSTPSKSLSNPLLAFSRLGDWTACTIQSYPGRLVFFLILFKTCLYIYVLAFFIPRICHYSTVCMVPRAESVRDTNFAVRRLHSIVEIKVCQTFYRKILFSPMLSATCGDPLRVVGGHPSRYLEQKKNIAYNDFLHHFEQLLSNFFFSPMGIRHTPQGGCLMRNGERLCTLITFFLLNRF